MDKFINDVAEILEIPAGELNLSSDLTAISTWDSLAHIVFITLLDKEYHKRAKASEVRAAKTVGDLYQMTIN